MRLFIPNNSTNYYVDFGRDAGGRRSTGTSDFDEATEIAEALEAKLRLSRFGLLPDQESKPTSTGIRLEVFAIKYVQFMSVTFPESPKTAEGARTAFKALTEFFGKQDPVLEAITVKDVERWKVHILDGRSRNTLAIYFRALHAAFNRAVTWGDSLENPFNQAERPQEVHSEDVRFFDDGQLLKLYGATQTDDPKKQIDPELVEMASFYLYTGMRRNEAIFCEVNDIDLDSRMLTIPGRKPKYKHRTKSGKPRIIPINDPLMDLIMLRLERREKSKVLRSTPILFPTQDNHGRPLPKPYYPTTVSKRMARWIKLAGLPNTLTLHSLRHTFASNLVQRGVSLYIVGELLGHSDLEVTKIYSHLTPQSYDWVLDLLDFSEPSVLDRIQRGKAVRAEAFDRRKMMQVVDEQAKEIDALRAENKRLKRLE